MIQHIWRNFFALVALVGLWTLPVGAAFGEHDPSGHMLALLADDEEGEDEDGIHQEGELFVDGDEEGDDEESEDEDGIHQEGELLVDDDEEDHDEENEDEDGIHQEGE